MKKKLEDDLWDAKKARSLAISIISRQRNHAFYADYIQFIKRMDDRIENLEKQIKTLEQNASTERLK